MNLTKIVAGFNRRLMRVVSFNYLEIFNTINSCYQFRKLKFSKKTVLIVEQNEFHAEILPGYCAYFKELGYDVIICLRRKNSQSSVFCRLDEKYLPHIFELNLWGMKYCLKYAQGFDIIFITSTILAQKNGYFGLFFDYLGFTPQGKQGYLVVEHNFPSLVDAIQKKRIDENRVFLLSAYNDGQYNIPMLNPNYFGKINIRKLNEHKIFVTVGTITNHNRSFSQLLSAVEALLQEKHENFQIMVVGKGNPEKIPDKLNKYIKFLGFLDFKELYDLIEEADFFLPLLDPENSGHQRYLDGETTGSRQLIMGFQIIPLINSVFGNAYQFNQNNAIIYEKDQLDKAMLSAMTISAEDYQLKCRNLELLANAVRAESMTNLGNKIAQISI
ncbi:glycosyltransferase [Methylobacter psychrophilus]|uniref:glycosyltransferase n=1 Tax=Methylobacter psychrophilus TaxID=96941 RepID=UPI0021D4AC44|nr:glycosyltransferase [Methylobacter psychrophilus]